MAQDENGDEVLYEEMYRGEPIKVVRSGGQTSLKGRICGYYANYDYFENGEFVDVADALQYFRRKVDEVLISDKEQS